MLTQESYNCSDIKIILVFRWFHGFWFNKECSFKSYFPSIIACQRKHHSHMFELSFHICIMKSHITFPASPEYIIFTSQGYGCINSVFKLYSSIGNNCKIGICGSAIHISRVRKKICCSPEKLNSSLFLHLFHNRNNLAESFFNFKNSAASDNICIVKAIITGSDLGYELKCSIKFVFCLIISGCIFPREYPRLIAKRILTIATE